MKIDLMLVLEVNDAELMERMKRGPWCQAEPMMLMRISSTIASPSTAQRLSLSLISGGRQDS